MKTELPKTKKHRTPEETLRLERGILASINREEPIKNLGSHLAVSKTYAYQIMSRLGYSQMLVSDAERDRIREDRGTASLFRREVARRAVA